MLLEIPNNCNTYNNSTMNNSPINSTINSTTVVELADASSLSHIELKILEIFRMIDYPSPMCIYDFYMLCAATMLR